MKEQLRYLIEIQGVDKSIGSLREKKSHLPEIIDEAKRSFDAAKEIQNNAKIDLERLTRERRDKERELEDQQEKLVKLKNRLSEVKTNKEYQACLIEIETANNEKKNIEDELLAIMENLDSKNMDLEEERRLLVEEEKKLEVEMRKINEDIEKINKETQELGSVYLSLSEKIEKNLLRRYNHLKQIRKEIAVVAINNNGACLGCLLQLPPQLVAEAKKNEKIMTCSYCHRILYWPECYAETKRKVN